MQRDKNEMRAGESTLLSKQVGAFLRTHNAKMAAGETGPGRGQMGLASLNPSVQGT